MTEKQMRESEVPWPKSIKQLVKYINRLVKQHHDYGTCVYAMSMSALATFYYVSHALGVTGFQASCADMDFLRRSRRFKMGFRLIDYSNLLYPQYLNKEHFPSIDDLMGEQAQRLAKEAKRLIKEAGHAHPDVMAHWKLLASRDTSAPENTKESAKTSCNNRMPGGKKRRPKSRKAATSAC